MSTNLHPLDWSIILIYVIGLISLGLARSRNSRKSSQEYILAGRRLSLPGFVATLVATWYGGILGIGENTYLYGLQTWFIFGLPYYFFAILFALFLAQKIHGEKRMSIPDHFHHHYGHGAGLTSALLVLVLASPAPYILSLGILLQYITGISFGWALLTATFISLVYIWYGGFGAVVRTDFLQMSLMFLGFFLLLFFAWMELGPPSQAFINLPQEHFDPKGGQGTAYILVWFFIALWTFVDPGFHQRTSAANSEGTARNGILVAVGFWFIFDMVTLLTGFYARALVVSAQPLYVFPLLAESILPPLVLGIFITGLLATIMSTVDSMGFISAVTFGRDILWRIKSSAGNETKEKDEAATNFTRSGLVAVGFISVLLAISIPSVVKLWYSVGSVVIPGLLLPFLLSFTSFTIRKKYSAIIIVLPAVVSFVWLVLRNLIENFPWNLEPFYPGLSVSILLILSLSEKEK